jgi:hypothetical protein
MAEITVQRGGETLRALFKILETMADGIHASDALKRLEQVLDLTPFEKARPKKTTAQTATRS